MKTTMNAPLSAEEEARVWRAWASLLAHSDAAPPDPNIPTMLSHATAVITAAHELRRAIADANYYANRRAFPGPRAKRPRVTVGGLALTIKELGITAEELEELRKIKAGR